MNLKQQETHTVMKKRNRMRPDNNQKKLTTVNGHGLGRCPQNSHTYKCGELNAIRVDE